MNSIIDLIRLWLCSLVLICLPGLAAQPGFALDNRVRAVPEMLVYTDAGDSRSSGALDGSSVVIVDKSRQRINIYGFRDTWRNLIHWPCSTGKIDGPKRMEGDHKTPEGIYFVTRDVDGRYLSPTYGDRALPLDFPNWLDRRQNNGGSAIWLHGTNRPLQARDSNGCVVLANDDIKQLAEYIRLQHTPVIIVDRIRLSSEKRSRAPADRILTAVDQWHRGMMYGDYASFSHWYANRHKPSMAWWQSWCRQRRSRGKGEAYRSAMRHRSIFRIDKVYVMLFDHVLMHGNRESWAGRRKLYITLDAGEVRIIGDTYQPGPRSGDDPLLSAWKKLYPVTFEPNELASGKAGRKGS